MLRTGRPLKSSIYWRRDDTRRRLGRCELLTQSALKHADYELKQQKTPMSLYCSDAPPTSRKFGVGARHKFLTLILLHAEVLLRGRSVRNMGHQ